MSDGYTIYVRVREYITIDYTDLVLVTKYGYLEYSGWIVARTAARVLDYTVGGPGKTWVPLLSHRTTGYEIERAL